MRESGTACLSAVVLFVFALPVQARYTETMDPKGPARDLKSDYGLVDDKAKSNQSGVFQKAIDDLAAAGGGRLIAPKGGVALRLETGAVGPQTAVYEITAKHVTCEDGRCAVMFGPHSAVNRCRARPLDVNCSQGDGCFAGRWKPDSCE